MSASLALLLLALQGAPVAVPPSYQLTADFDPDGSVLTVHAEVAVRHPAADSLIVIPPGDGIGVRVPHGGGATVTGDANLRQTESGRMLLRVQPGSDAVLSMDYTLTLDTVRLRQNGFHLVPATGPANAWYPGISGLADSLQRFADFEVTLELPAELRVLTSGTLVDSAVTPRGIRRHYRARHLEGFALAIADGRYLIRSVRGDSITVSALSPRADTLVWDRVAAETIRAASWYRREYGFFPVTTMGIIPGSRGARGGFPLSRMFMIHQGDLSPGFIRWITAHELAHNYWGLHVLSSAERLDWLMLGLGIWTDEWYLARTNGVPLEVQWRDPEADNSFERLAAAQLSNIEQRLGIPEAEADSLPYDYNSLVRHAKAATAIYLLSLRLGPERMVDLQRRLLQEFRYRPLAPEVFAARLEQAGVAGAGDFLARWMRGDARLDYVVSETRLDPSSPYAYWITVERGGTIAVPLTLEVRGRAGKVVRADLPLVETDDSVRVQLEGPLEEIRIDPDGALPMWSGGNRGMQGVWLRAMGEVGPLDQFLVLARAYLAGGTDRVVGAQMVERLFAAGQFGEVGRLAAGWPWLTECVNRVSCLASLQVARSWVRTGHRARAVDLLSATSTRMNELGLGGLRRLAATRTEVQSER